MKNQMYYQKPLINNDVALCAKFALKELKRYHPNLKSNFAELSVIHLFLTKNNVAYAMNKSFSPISTLNKLEGQKLFPELPQFLAVRNALFLIYSLEKTSIPVKRSYSNVVIKKSTKETNSINPAYEYEENNDFHRKIYVLNKYLKDLYFDINVIDYLIARLGSYYLHLYQKYASFYNTNNDVKLIKFYKENKFNSAKRLHHLIFNAKSKNIEKNINAAYSLLTKNKSDKNETLSLKYFFKENSRVYHRLIWESYKKPVFFKHCPKFYNALFTLTNALDYNSISYSNDINFRNEMNKLLIYISIDAVFTENMKIKLN